MCGAPAVGYLTDLDEYPVCLEHAAMAEEDPEAYGRMTYFSGPAIEVTTDRRTFYGPKAMIILLADGGTTPFTSFQDHEITDEELAMYQRGLQFQYPGCVVVRAADAS